MAWNNGLERKRFDEEQEKLAMEYRTAGMTEEQIEQMHQFDLEAFNSRRRFFEHTQQFPEDVLEGSKDDKSPLLEKFLDALSVDFNLCSSNDRYWWIEEIENPSLAKIIKTLPPDDIELITQYVFEQKTQIEISKQLAISNVAVFKRIEKLKKFFREFL